MHLALTPLAYIKIVGEDIYFDRALSTYIFTLQFFTSHNFNIQYCCKKIATLMKR